jgi:hypothetical protein
MLSTFLDGDNQINDFINNITFSIKIYCIIIIILLLLNYYYLNLIYQGLK